MTRTISKPTLEDVLDAFAMERNPHRVTLERYLLTYPEYGPDLVDLSRELSRSVEDDSPLSAEDNLAIDTAWSRHLAAAPQQATNPLAQLDVESLRELAQKLGVKLQVMVAFRERRVILDTVPARFCARFAEVVNYTVEALRQGLAMPSPALARSMKADGKPVIQPPISFEQLLIEADTPEAERKALLAD